MASTRLRERQKQQTRELIAATAARLFAEHGYENVAVLDIARAAEVSEQTVYNHFPTKERLVLDNDEELRDQLVQAIRNRPARTSPAAAIREHALAWIDGFATLPAEHVRGGLGHLAARSPAVRRLSLEMTDRHADAIAAALAEDVAEPAVAKLHAIALAWVFQTITDETGRRTAQGISPRRSAHELHPVVEAMIDTLDRWYLDTSAGATRS